MTDQQKYEAVVSAGLSEGEQLKALESVLGEGEFGKLSAAHSQGISPADYVNAMAVIRDYDENKNGAISQEEAKKALKSMKEQRAALWQVQNKSWKPEKNPFSTKVGREVYKTLNWERSEGLSLPSP